MRQLLWGKRNSIYTPTVLLLVSIVGVSFLGLGLVMPLRALYGREIGASSTEIGLMTASFLLAGFIASPGIGWLADRFGYKNVLWVGLLLHAVLMLAYIPVQNPILLIGLRAIEGVASVSVLPPTRALMNTIAPKTRQGEALGLLSAAQTTGILIGPAVGAVLASQTGYTLSFVIASVPLVIAALVTLLFLPSAKKQEQSSAETHGMFSKGLFTRPLMLTYTLQVVLMLTNGVVMSIWSLYMLDRGASLPLIGLSYTTFALPIIFLAPLGGRLSDRYGRYWPFLIGLVFTGLIFGVYSTPVNAWAIVVISALEGAASAIARSALDGLLADVMPQQMKGKAQANFSAAGLIGNLIGATMAGLLYSYGTGIPFLVEGLISVAAGAVLLLPNFAREFRATRRVHAEDALLPQILAPESVAALGSVSQSKPEQERSQKAQQAQQASHNELRQARTCYDHLAGELGVALSEALAQQHILNVEEKDYVLTEQGQTLLEGWGVNVNIANGQRRAFARRCLDWTERRDHLGGALGATICSTWLERGWVQRHEGSRALFITPDGVEQLRAWGGAGPL